VGKDLTFVILLPKKHDGLADLEKSLSPAALANWLKATRKTELYVTVPKFKVTWEFSLKDTLSKMGMPTAFTDRADLTGIASVENLHLADVVHKAFVD